MKERMLANSGLGIGRALTHHHPSAAGSSARRLLGFSRRVVRSAHGQQAFRA